MKDFGKQNVFSKPIAFAYISQIVFKRRFADIGLHLKFGETFSKGRVQTFHKGANSVKFGL